MDDSKLDAKSNFYSQTLQVTLSAREPISPDTYIFTFTFQHPKDNLGLLITQHMIIFGQNLKGEVVGRKYTATSPFDQEGSFDIPIKIYRPNVHPLYPEGGQLTPWLEQIKIGTVITIRRCIGKLIYRGLGNCIINQDIIYINSPKDNKDKKVTHVKTMLMTCGGTGITPIYQLIQAIINDPKDQTKIFLLYANRTESDILLRDTLEGFQNNNPDRLSIAYCLDQGNENWKGFVGFVTLEMMQKSFPPPDEHTLATLCGPKPMNKLVLQLYLNFGITEKNLLKF